MTDIRVGTPFLAGPRRAAAAAIGLVGLGVAGTLALLPFEGPLPPLAGLATFALVGALVLDRLAPWHPHQRFGVGNGVTLVRAGGAAVFVALATAPGILVGAHAWGALAAAALLLALDGIDGFAARRGGLASTFGARFDMETDALLILALSAIAAGLGKAGPWVLGLGLMRYAFLGAQAVAPVLVRPLPPSHRRRLVCGLQVAVLGLLLAPPVVAPLSEALAIAAFAALAGSFGADVAWLVRRRT